MSTATAPVSFGERRGAVAIREIRGPRWALPLGWVVTRFLMFALVTSPNAINRLLPDLAADGDVDVYYRAYRGIHAGHLPYVNFRYEYPPGTLLTLIPLPRGLTFDSFLLVWQLQMIAFDALIFWAILRLGRVAGARTPAIRAAAWAWIIGGIVLTGLPLVRNDLIACCAVAWAFVFFYERKLWWAGALFGLGAVTKLWPVLILLVLLAGLRRDRVKLAAGSLVPVAITGVALTATGTLGACLEYLKNYHGHRPLEIESLFVRPIQLAAVLGGHRAPIDTSYGSINLAGYHELVVVSSLATVLITAGVLILVFVRRGTGASRNALVVASVCMVAASLATAKVFSPQYILWLLVVACCAGATGALPRGWLWLAVAATALTGAEYPLWFSELIQCKASALAVLTARDVTVVALAIGSGIVALRLLRTGTPKSLRFVAS